MRERLVEDVEAELPADRCPSVAWLPLEESVRRHGVENPLVMGLVGRLGRAGRGTPR
jgi:hypothetical protein